MPLLFRGHNATHNVGTSAYLGPVTITATVEGGATGSATIQIVP
jgi:hypothetical protein